MSERILLLHPGAMGTSLGAALRANEHRVRWVAEGRSPATVRRAQDAGFTPTDGLEDAIRAVDHVLSVCPPHAAVAVAEAVMAAGLEGTYVDANAVSPDTARRIGTVVGSGFVDGGIVGPPAWRPGVTRLYLSGTGAGEVAGWFSGTLVDARAVSGSASALKMCYAAFTKGSSALLLAIRALAEREGVTDALLAEWALSQPGLPERSAATAVSTSAKAWRFEGEMREIAATFDAAGLPGGFHEAAAEVFGRMSPLKDAADTDIERVVAHLLGNDRE